MATSTTDNNRLCDLNNASLLIVDIQTHLTAAMPVKVLARLQRNAGLLLKTAGLLDVPVYLSVPKELWELSPRLFYVFWPCLPPRGHFSS